MDLSLIMKQIKHSRYIRFVRVCLLFLAFLACANALSSCSRISDSFTRARTRYDCRNANERTDFYRTINREWLIEHSVPPDGYSMYSSFVELDEQNDRRLVDLFDELADDTRDASSPYASLIALYRAARDLPESGPSDLAKLKPILQRYEEAASIADLLEADLAFHDDTGCTNLLLFDIWRNEDGTAILNHCGPTPDQRDVYTSKRKGRAYIDYLKTLFILTGLDKDESLRRAKAVYGYERELNSRSLSGQASIDPKNARTYPFYLFRTYYPMVDFPAFFRRMGLDTPEFVLNFQQGILEYAAASFQERNLETLSLYAQARVLKTFGRYCSFACVRADDALYTKLYGARSILDDGYYRKRLALMAVKNFFPQEVGRLFAERFCSGEVKADVTAIVQDVIGVYKKRISESDWLEPYTRDRAIAKLDAMRINVAYPDEWAPPLLLVPEGTSLADDALLEGVITVSKSRRTEDVRAYGQKINEKEWRSPIYIANAFYNPRMNEVYIPAGILQSPFYEAGADDAANLGGIGCVIAHEVSHAFDNNGSQFDSAGDVRQWWTLADHTRFKERCDKVAAFFDGAPVSPGVVNKGALTVSENLADLLGVECALNVLARTGTSDYRPFFTSFATVFRTSMTSNALKYLSEYDVHSIGPARVNRTLSNFSEFRETFGVSPGDALFVADEDQIKIW